MADRNALILRNHGIVAAGRTLEEAVWIALKLERACRVQLMAEWAGGPKHIAEGEDLEEEEPARHAAGPLHQRVQLPRALMVPRARQARRPLLRRALRDGFERVQGITLSGRLSRHNGGAVTLPLGVDRRGAPAEGVVVSMHAASNNVDPHPHSLPIARMVLATLPT